MTASISGVPPVECHDLPQSPSMDIAYRLLPKDPDDAYYRERTDRNIGWITRQEQSILRDAVVGIAGCGGMGGLLASLLTRAGIGEVRIADCETFDISNINRQFGAMRGTVGESKALVTAQLTRAVTDDATLVVYPQGITEATVDAFLDSCDVVCDEIELLAIDARILLHRQARAAGVPLLNCNTVGFSTNLFAYTPDGMTIEAALGFDYDTARELRQRAGAGDRASAERIASNILRVVIPELPEYCPQEPESDRAAFLRRLAAEQKASIIATNPSFAGGFLANRVLLHLLRDSRVARDIVPTPAMPEYLYVDALRLVAERRTHRGVS